MSARKDASAKPSVRRQHSSGGVAWRRREGRVEVAVIRPQDRERWQLPKGTVDRGETDEQAALREVREEAGIDTELEGPLETVEYWYWATDRGRRARIHKTVAFHLLRYVAGDVRQHDHEVAEARWVPLEEAIAMLSFESERHVLELARERIEGGSG